MYDERLVTPMRQELTRLGVKELRTPEEVDANLKEAKGTTLVIVNSVCGCSARMARPAVAVALQNPIKPDHLTTVFAGTVSGGPRGGYGVANSTVAAALAQANARVSAGLVVSTDGCASG